MAKKLIVLLALMMWTVPSRAAVLLHRYTFDNGVSDSAGAVDGTLLNGAKVSGGTLNLAGLAYVQFPAYLVPASDFTVALWAREAVDTPDYVEFISQGHSGAPGFYVGHDPSYGMRVGDTWMGTGVAFPTDNQWHHYAVVSNPGTVGTRLYIDGQLKATYGGPYPVPQYSDQTRLGRQFQYAEYLQGSLDDVRIYSGTLTGGEVAALVPEPATGVLVVAMAVMAAARRRRVGW